MTVNVSERVIRELRALAIQSFQALPRRGIEVGGILFGRVRDGRIEVESYEEAPCEHRFGPSYALSDDDRARLKEQLDACAARRLRVIGFFRSFTGRDPVIEEADERYVSERFPTGNLVFLMLQPRSSEDCVASYRFFEDGRLLREGDDPPRQFAARELPPSRRVMEEEKATQPAAPPRRTRWWIPALVCILAGVGGAAVWELWGLARAPRWMPLHLDATLSGGHVELTWDAEAARALRATSAALEVNDAGAHRQILLNPAQMLAGHYSYEAARPDVGLRLILYASNLAVDGDAIRLESVPTAVAEAAPAAAPPAPKGEAERATPVSGPPAAVAPSIVHEVQASVPEGIRSRLTEQVVIPVEVAVDNRGRVTKAVAEGKDGDSVHRYLADLAERTARQWRFLPARSKKGTKVAGVRTIHFVFGQ